MKIIAIIPARGGSKGVPRKNILPLGGKPLIAHSIAAAKESRYISEVVVSTDSEEIADISKEWGASVVMRPAELATDTSSSESALLHVLHRRIDEGMPGVDVVVFLQCTSPFTTSEDIDGVVAKIVDDGADSALAVAPFHYFLWKNSPTGGVVGVNHQKDFRLMRQQREPEYIETGSVYAMRAEMFLERKHRFFGKTDVYVVDPEHVLEIDDPHDFKLAEMKMGLS